ncbi:uncharacterized protein LOC112004418 isoform X2 [Quercus suber]|uniref:uncharacterized protein LOC112004418 isoform X2 n=1 Tax=Quercus suber TaxID=58331 RepID=UPI0032DE3581
MLESFFHSARLRRNREDPWLKPQAEEFYGMKECEVGEAITTRYEDITNTLDQVELKTMVHIAFRIEESTKKIFPAIVFDLNLISFT